MEDIQALTKETVNFNLLIVAAIRPKLNNQEDLSQTLASLLHLSKSAIYRKINGEVPFSFHEVILLAQKFHISLDDLILKGGSATGFRFKPPPELGETDVNFYDRILGILTQFSNTYEAVELHLATREIAPFLFMNFPELTAFQNLIWSKVTMRFKNTEEENFKLEQQAYNPEMTKRARLLTQSYLNMPGTEYISSNILDQNLSALVQFQGHSLFDDPRTPLLLCEQLEQLVKYQFQMAKLGRKVPLDDYNGNHSPNVPYTLFHDHLPNYDTLLLFKLPSKSFVYSSFNFPNFMSTTNPKMAKYVERWLLNARTHSSRISGEGELNRITLQHHMLSKIAKLKERLSNQ